MGGGVGDPEPIMKILGVAIILAAISLGVSLLILVMVLT